RFFLLERPARALSLFAWSIPFWLLFELLNFRLTNWYYVFVPNDPVARWSGITLSFATVLPAIFLSERTLRAYGPWRDVPDAHGPERRPPAAAPGGARRLDARALVALQALGLVCVLLPLAWPGIFFPLVWVAVTLIADPWVYRRQPRRSLIRDLETGRFRRPIRLVVGGMAIGLLWELFNFQARGKWIYTVPGLEELKLFEMPLLGFFGFPFLALEGWSAYQALVVAGVAADPGKAGGPRAESGARPLTRSTWTVFPGALATVFSVLVLRAMEIETISSTTPQLRDLDGPPVVELRAHGLDVFDLADAEPGELSDRIGVPPERTRAWIDEARLITLRGIGAANAEQLRTVGVESVRELADQDPDALAARLAASGDAVLEARVRVWVRAAIRASS
ncbi:MAG TPA: DUF4332 domain-containing protein, partial [Gemmatimonadota bacterium]|nr:DUF4332 domain-containing protein [Gemmatimonadota bacterium]